MKTISAQRLKNSGYRLAAAGLLGVLPTQASTFITGLDGVATSSTFETGSIINLPTSSWANVVGSARYADLAGLNGAMIGTSEYDNYTVQFNTSTPIQPDSVYTLQLQMGYYAGLTGGNSGYSFRIGTVNGGVFSPSGAAATGNFAYPGGGMGADSANLSSPVSVMVTTGALVSGDNLSIQWSQTSSLGSGSSDYFGFDNVTLSVSAVPEPREYALVTGLALIGLVAWRRRGRR